MNNVTPLPTRGGGFAFTCTDCNVTVLAAVSDGFPVCLTCRWLNERPSIPAEIRDRIRGITRDRNGENGCGNG